MLKLTFSIVVVFVVLTTNLFADNITAQTVYEGPIDGHIDAIIHKKKLYVSYQSGTNGKLTIWSKDSGAVVIDEAIGTGYYSSMAIVDGKLAVAYLDNYNKNYKLWLDKSGDCTPQQNEFAIIAKVTVPSSEVSIKLIVHNDKLALVFPTTSGSQTSDRFMHYWIDDGYNGEGTGGIAGDGIVNGDEIRTLTDNAGVEPDMISYQGKLSVCYREYSYVNNHFVRKFRFWHDADGDDTVSEEEVKTISEGFTGYRSSMVIHKGHLVMQYFDSGEDETRLWVDDNENFTVDDDEIKALDGFPIYSKASLFVANEKLGSSFTEWSLESSQTRVKLWRDDNDLDIAEPEIDVLTPYSKAKLPGRPVTVVDEGTLCTVFYQRISDQNDQKLLVSETAQSSPSSAIAGKRSDGSGCLVSQGTGIAFYVMLVFLALLSRPWRLRKST